MRTVLRRGATTLPGRVALAVDPDLIAHLAPCCERGSVVVCGTNGKTTTTNVVACAVEAAGMSVLCNRAGANMASGIACALLGGRADWGVFENDELSTVHVVPKLKPRDLVLLNLFRDQLDRCGEIDRVQQTIADALAASPETTLLVNADDPLCRGVAHRAHTAGTPVVTFGIDGDLGLPADRVTGGGFCQVCGAPLTYAYRQYGQLGDYSCPACGFARGELDYAATNVRLLEEGASFDVVGRDLDAPVHLETRQGGAYMVYNLLAAFVAARRAGVGADVFQGVLDTYRPQNGRLQRFAVAGRPVTLNLAKNPTGFNQNMALLAADPAPKVVYIAINDDYNDGKDVSWLWDVDFERLADAGEACVFAGGHRANDMQVRLKYAGVKAELADGVADVLARTEALGSERHVWVLTNYSALWPAKAELERLGEAR
jgi:UDP-N-acetylmuramyl tripeptide synthase